MGISLRIEGVENIFLGEHSIQSCVFMTDTSDDSNARSTDVVNTVRITGKILTALDGFPVDDTMKLARWSMVRAENVDSYRKVTIDTVLANQVVRKVYMPNAFVVGYEERYGDTEGVGEFILTVRQKKDLFEGTTVQGGYGV